MSFNLTSTFNSLFEVYPCCISCFDVMKTYRILTEPRKTGGWAFGHWWCECLGIQPVALSSSQTPKRNDTMTFAPLLTFVITNLFSFNKYIIPLYLLISTGSFHVKPCFHLRLLKQPPTFPLSKWYSRFIF